LAPAIAARALMEIGLAASDSQFPYRETSGERPENHGLFYISVFDLSRGS